MAVRKVQKTPALEEVATRFVAAKQQLRILEEEVKATQDELLELIEDKANVRIGTTTFILTKVAGFRKNYLAEIIKKQLSPANWKKVQKVEVDRAKLEACLKAGDFELTDDYVEHTPVRPYIKLTEWSDPIRAAHRAA